MLHIFTFGAKLRRPEGSSCPDQVVSNHVAITPTSPEAMTMKRHGKDRPEIGGNCSPARPTRSRVEPRHI
jgi:hypothetical protein